MDWGGSAQTIATAVALAIIFGIARLFQRQNTLETKVQPVIDWWFKTSMDALRLATNPTSKRLMALANKYIESVSGKEQISMTEKKELINGLLEIYNDKDQLAGKRQSASISLRFIETREGMQLLPKEFKAGSDH